MYPDDDEAFYEAEAELANAEQTIDIPKPSDNAATAAQWIKDPCTMLTDLTTGLNTVLRDCRMRVADGPYLNYEAEERGRWVPVIFLMRLLHTVPIRNAIEDCPFKAEVIQGLLDFVLTSDDDAQKMPYRTLSNLVDAYRKQLRYLAEWIEARKILKDEHSSVGKKRSQKTSDQTPLTYEEWHSIMERMQKAGLKVAKPEVRRFAKAELGTNRSLSSDLHQRFVTRMKREKGGSGPQSAK